MKRLLGYFGVSKVRIGQIEKQALGKINKVFNNNEKSVLLRLKK